MATRHTASSVLLAATLLMTDAPAFAQTAEPIRYTLSFPAPHTHYAEVTATVPTGRQPVAELMMAVWTPGSYMVREYSRNVEAVTAAGARRPRAGRGEVREEPLARDDRRRAEPSPSNTASTGARCRCAPTGSRRASR